MSFSKYLTYKDSGIEWLGSVPSEWSIAPIKAVASCNDEVLPDSTDSEAVIEYVEISGVEEGRGITETETLAFGAAPSRARRVVRHGDVLISTVRTYLRAIATVSNPPENLVASTGFAAIRPRAVDAGFLGYLLHAEFLMSEIIARSVGISYPAINASELMHLKAPIPSLQEQQAIVAFLDRETEKIDALVNEQKRLIELLKEKRQALISQAVTKGLDPSVPMKDSGVEWLGEVPDAWSVKELKWMVVATNAGEVIDRSFWGGSSELLYSCALKPLGCDYEGFPEWKRTGKDDLLVTRNGTPYVHKPVAGSIYTNVVQRVTLAPLLCRDFMAIALQNAADNLRGYGVSIESLNYEMWKALPIAVPALPEQTAIATFLDRETGRIDKLITEAQSASMLLQERRSTLISAAVTGKIDVRGHAPQLEGAAV